MTTWYNPAWQYRKKITVAASEVPGDLAGFPVHYDETSTIPTLGRADGYDLLVTGSDGTTKLPHKLYAWEPLLTANGVWTWFNDPRAVYYNGKVYTGWINDDADIIVASIDVNSGAYVQTTLKTDINSGEEDDHNNPAIVVLRHGANAGKILCCYSGHNATTAHCRLSTSAGDISTFGTEVNITESLGGNAVQYTYAHVFEFEDGTIRWYFRNFNATGDIANEREHRYMDSSDSGATWGSSVAFFIDGTGNSYRPYFQMFQSPSNQDRIDFAVNPMPPGEDPGGPLVSDIYHFWMSHGESSDTYYASDSTELSVDLTSAPIEVSDMDSSSLVWDASAQAQRSWVWDIKTDGNDDIAILFATFQTTASIDRRINHRLRHAYKNIAPDTAWAVTEVADMGMPLVYPIHSGTVTHGPQPYYSGGACFAHATGSLWDVYASVPDTDLATVSVGHRRIKRYTSASLDGSDWSGERIAGVHGRQQFRPIGIRGANGDPIGSGILDIPILWCSGPYSNFESPDYDGVGIGCDQALAQTGYFAVNFKADLDSSEDTEFYLYYGNSGANNQQDIDNYRPSDILVIEYGNVPFADLGSIAVTLASEAEATFEIVGESREAGITSNQTLLSDWTASAAGGRKVLMRVVSGNTVSAFMELTSAGTVSVAGNDSLGADTPFHVAWVLDDDDNLARLYVNGVADGTIAASNTLNAATGSTDLRTSTTPHRHTSTSLVGEPFAGMIYAVIISQVARSTDWITTNYNMLADAANFWSASAAENASENASAVTPFRRGRTRSRMRGLS